MRIRLTAHSHGHSPGHPLCCFHTNTELRTVIWTMGPLKMRAFTSGPLQKNLLTSTRQTFILQNYCQGPQKSQESMGVRRFYRKTPQFNIKLWQTHATRAQECYPERSKNTGPAEHMTWGYYFPAPPVSVSGAWRIRNSAAVTGLERSKVGLLRNTTV